MGISLTPALDRLTEILKTPEGQKAALDWLTSPFTLDALAAAREKVRAIRPKTSEPNDITLAFGEMLGANDTLDFLSTLHVLGRSPVKLPIPDYGAREIVRKSTVQPIVGKQGDK